MSIELVDDEPTPVPHRKLAPGKLVIASHNEGKVREIRDLLQPYGIEPISAASLGIPEPEETGTSFAANAELKARFSADLSGLLARWPYRDFRGPRRRRADLAAAWSKRLRL